jgi:hypothetical protein
MRAVLGTLDPNCARDRMLRAYYLECWQLVCRSGDLIRGKRAAADSPWNPDRDTHLGRVRFEWMVRADGSRMGRCILRLEPGKTDPEGRHHFEKTCLVDHAPDALTFGAALEMMLGELEASDDLVTSVPLFCDPRTGRELTYTAAAAALRERLMRCGFPELASGLHSLRIGGASACASTGRMLMSAFAGKWFGPSSHLYQHAMQDDLEETLLAMARGTGGALAVRPGPVASYAR